MMQGMEIMDESNAFREAYILPQKAVDFANVDSGLLILLNVALSLATYFLIAKWYLLPRLAHIDFEEAVTPMLLFHTTRHVGMFFLAPGVVKNPLPLEFAVPAAYGDLLAAVLAFIAIFALRTKSRWARIAVWIFNIEGFVDLLYALGTGLRVSAQENFGAAMWIPTVIVPALLVTHGIIFHLLLRSGETEIKKRQ